MSRANCISRYMDSETPNRKQAPFPGEPRDPIPNPEPVSPSLDEPDPGVFHHDPAVRHDPAARRDPDRRIPDESKR